MFTSFCASTALLLVWSQAAVAQETASIVSDPQADRSQAAAPTPDQASTQSANATGEQQVSQTGLKDIIVTAQRHSESLQRAAIPVSAVSGDSLAAAGVTRPTELTAVIPALQVAPAAGPYNLFYLRGVGNFNGNALSDSAIAFNFDGAYISRPSGTNGFFYDLDRVEVVKGPQGTLYGRNATGGAINVISKRPELGTFGTNAAAEYGNYNALRVDGAVNIPLGSEAALRIAGVRVRHDGYNADGTDDQNEWGGRVSLRVEPASNFSIDIVADYFNQRGKGVGVQPLGQVSASVPDFAFDARYGALSPQGQAYYALQPNTLMGRTFYAPTGVHPYQHNDNWGITSTIEWRLPVGTLTVIPAYRRSSLNYTGFPGFYLHQEEVSDQQSVEARFATSDENPVRLLLGGFLFDESIKDPSVQYVQQSNGSYQTLNLDTKSQAVFGRLTWAVTPKIRVSAGGRYTWEQKDFSGTVQAWSRICTATTTYFPTYVPGCPTTPQIPYGPTPPTLDLNPSPDGAITVPSFINDTGSNSRHASFSKFTYRLGADWDITSRNLLYASFETGFKSGGFFFSSDNGVYQPERIDAYTIGSKNRFFSNRLQFNLEGFYWKYKDQQISIPGIDSQNIAIFPTFNVGRTTFKGVEAEIKILPFPNTTLSADVQYLDARYDSFVYRTPNRNSGTSNGTSCPNGATPGSYYTIDCSGRRPPNAPEWTINLGAQQRVAFGSGAAIVIDARGHYQTDTMLGLALLPLQDQQAYWLADAAVTFYAPERRFFVGGFVNNMFDETVKATAQPVTFGNFLTTTLRPPRTYGIRAGVKF